MEARPLIELLAGAVLAAFGTAALAGQAAPPASRPAAPDVAPDFGPNVLIVHPETPDLQAKLDAIHARQEANQFGPERHAILFMPGRYDDLDVQVGFYTHVAGLGRSPDDVDINGAVRVKARWLGNNNATCNFWRAAENLSVTPTRDGNVNVWATSQGVSMRRVHVKGDLNLSDGGWSSGGFLADSKIDGRVDSGSQQQWLSRNAEWGAWVGGNWNMVFVGVDAPPAGEWPERPYTTIERTPVIREKPFLFVDGANGFAVRVPELAAGPSRGTTWSTTGETAGRTLPIADFHIARADRDDAATMSAALAAGKHLLLTPGVYALGGTIRVDRPGAIVMGIGYATLVADAGAPAMRVADVDGVTIAGVLFEAGEVEAPVLLEVGAPGAAASHASDPTFLFDVNCRAGGAIAGRATTFIRVHSKNVVGDNLWLWRADHGAGATWDVNRNDHGLIVDGDDVTVYGLFVEHTQKHQTIWNGEGGRVYLYQSEMPYDPPAAAAWSSGEAAGYASYKVAEHVTTHEAWGLGVYCVFTSAPVVADSAIEAPAAPGVRLRHMVAIRLSGLPGSGIRHVLNGEGASVITTQKATLN